MTAISPAAEYGIGERVGVSPELAIADHDWPEPIPRGEPSGILSEIVDAIAPHVEPNRESILFQLIVMVGAALGRGPHALVGSVRHGTNEYVLVVGPTGSAKGSARSEAEAAMVIAEPSWKRLLLRGVSSGEGIVHRVRDGGTLASDHGGKGNVDAGVSDKRLLIVETEFARVLAVMDRKGSTVSTTLRDAWDGDDLGTSSKNAPEHATAPHIALAGHITFAELRKHSADENVANGLLNRMLFCCARMERLVPNPSSEYVHEVQRLAQELGRRLTRARQFSNVPRDDAAEAYWCEIYPDLRQRSEAGLLGSLLQRAAPHVVRLSVILAVVDGSPNVRLPHLEGALAIWRYSEASAARIFGTGLTDPRATRILEALEDHPDGMSRTEIHALFSRHVSSDQLIRLLRDLEETGSLERSIVKTGGRPGERWKRITLNSLSSHASHLANGIHPSARNKKEKREESEERKIERLGIITEAAVSSPRTRTLDGSQ